MTGVFGPALDGDDVEAALLAHLKDWMPTYVPYVLRQKDPDQELWPEGVEPLEEFTVRHAAAEKWPEEQLPMLLAYSPGLAAPVVRHGDGQVDAVFSILISAIASGVDVDDTKRLARLYGTAANLAIMHHPDLSGFANAVDWIDGRNYPITRGVEAERNLMAVSNIYVIEVENILNTDAGPLHPVEEPEVEPDPRPRVKKGGASVKIESGVDAVELLRTGGFFDEDDQPQPAPEDDG